NRLADGHVHAHQLCAARLCTVLAPSAAAPAAPTARGEDSFRVSIRPCVHFTLSRISPSSHRPCPVLCLAFRVHPTSTRQSLTQAAVESLLYNLPSRRYRPQQPSETLSMRVEV